MIRLALLLIGLSLCSGCASAIYKGGRFHDVLQRGTSRDEIRQAMGSPVDSGEERNFGSSVYDDFVVRGPVYDSSRSAGAAMGAGMTFGLSELIAVPQALWWSLTDRGMKQVRVLYSADYIYRLHFVQDEKGAASRSDSATNAEQGAPGNSRPAGQSSGL
jgi:hypothetical protein